MPHSTRGIPFSCLQILAAERPTTQHRKVIYAAGAVLLYRHCCGYGHPAGGLIARYTDGLVGTDTRQSGDVGDVSIRLVFVRRRPLLDNGTDGEQPVSVVVGSGEQPESCSPPPLHRFKLTERCVCLLGTHALPLILTTADIQWIIISNSSW